MRGLFVTGTDTDVGKTVVAALLALNLPGNWSYWKPIQSGTIPSTDRESVRVWTGLPEERLPAEAYRLVLPASPHVSAAAENIEIRPAADFVLPACPVIVEGAGGALVPINDQDTMLDLMVHLQLPVVLVARTRLGTINHTLLSLEALRHRSLTVAALVLNGEAVPTTTETLRARGHVPLLTELPPLPRLDPETLRAAYARHFSAWPEELERFDHA